jgi:threonine aldolase
LLWIENSINGRGGKVFPLDNVASLYNWAKNRSLPIFLDGARLLNAIVATNRSPAEYGRMVDALTICFSKGLGAPMGSALIGSKAFIAEARRFRKWYGGALHQAGFIAAAALYALRNNVLRLADDHENAELFANTIRASGTVTMVRCETNIVLFDVAPLTTSAAEFVARAAESGVRLLSWSAAEVRAVFNMNVSKQSAQVAADRIAQLIKSYPGIAPKANSRRFMVSAVGVGTDRTNEVNL